MIDHTRKDLRCRITRFVRTVAGDLVKDSQGTIQFETDNFERLLIMVAWDEGFTVPVFPDEIELVEKEEGHVGE